MKIPRQFKIIAAVTAIFIMGAGAGFAIALAQQPTAAPAVEKRWAAQEMQLFKERLHLTPEQVESLRPVFADTAGKLRDIRRETAQKIAAVIKENTAAVAKQLTPEQLAYLDGLVREKHRQRDEKLKRLTTDSESP
jgi:uncharacterized membrane protein